MFYIKYPTIGIIVARLVFSLQHKVAGPKSHKLFGFGAIRGDVVIIGDIIHYYWSSLGLLYVGPGNREGVCKVAMHNNISI